MINSPQRTYWTTGLVGWNLDTPHLNPPRMSHILSRNVMWEKRRANDDNFLRVWGPLGSGGSSQTQLHAMIIIVHHIWGKIRWTRTCDAYIFLLSQYLHVMDWNGSRPVAVNGNFASDRTIHDMESEQLHQELRNTWWCAPLGFYRVEIVKYKEFLGEHIRFTVQHD